MVGPLWSFFLDLAPIRHELRDQVGRAREEIEQQARNVLDSDRQRHRKTLDQSNQRVAELKRHNGELSRHNDELHRDNAALRARVAKLEAVNRDRQSQLAALRKAERQRREQEIRDADATTSDLFCCQNPDCRSLWLLSRRPDHSYAAKGPIGPGCATCAEGDPVLRLAAVKAAVIEAGEPELIPRPDRAVPDPVDLTVPGQNRAARTEIGAKFVADLVQRGPDAAIAGTLAHQARTVVQAEADRIDPATRCAGLAAIADGLDRVPGAIRDGIAWCATEIVGVPEVPAKILGDLGARIVLHPVPLHTIAQGIRAIGAVSCAVDDRLGNCQCARHLLGDAAEAAVTAELKASLGEAVRELDTAVETPASRIDDDLSIVTRPPFDNPFDNPFGGLFG